MTMHVWTTTTAVGPWSVIADAGVVLASGFATPDVMTARLAGAPTVAEVQTLPMISTAVERYLGGEVEALNDLQVRQPGGPFQQHVWDAMRGIPAGSTWSYSELATKSGRPGAVRAAATACARNLVAPIVPCHRVIRTDGTLGGYYYGLEVKEWLLRHEQR
jgi:methylated-DNA-[protein]-cysteine S-methyltransferase